MASGLRGGALDVNNTPLPNSIGTRTGIKEMSEASGEDRGAKPIITTPLPNSIGEMSEPQAKTEGRLREARYLERGRGVGAGRLLETPLRTSAGKRRRPPPRSRRPLADGESASGRSVGLQWGRTMCNRLRWEQFKVAVPWLYDARKSRLEDRLVVAVLDAFDAGAIGSGERPDFHFVESSADCSL